MLSKFIQPLWERRGIIILLVVGALTITTWIQDTLQLYIHPRYILFTVVMSMLGLVLSLAAISRYSGHTHEQVNWLGVLAMTVAVGFSLVALMLPPKGLSYSLALNRGAGSSNATIATPKISLVRNTERLSLADWASLISQSVDGSQIIGKRASFSGFVIPADGDTFLSGRFVVTCCAVDARPTTVEVLYPQWREFLTGDDWVELRGQFVAYEGRVVLQPDVDGVNITERPTRQYAE